MHQAVLAGHSALFTTAAQMLLDLGSQDSTRALERRLRYYAHPRLLCIDEIGCAPRGAESPRGARSPPEAAAAASRS